MKVKLSWKKIKFQPVELMSCYDYNFMTAWNKTFETVLICILSAAQDRLSQLGLNELKNEFKMGLLQL